jgi:uncharacterized protein
MIRTLALLIFVLLGMPVASAQTVSFDHARVEIVTRAGGHHSFDVEMAVSPEQLAQGLMFRRTLAAGAGMLFDFGSPRQVAMWMKNTLIPLDMLFMDRGGRVIYVEEYAVPGSLQPRGPSDPVLGVLELPAGTARHLSLKVGDRVDHPMFGRGN